MIEFEVTERFAHPPRRILDALTSLDHVGAWLPDLVALERLEGEGYAVGTTWKETRRVFGADVTEHVEVVELEPPGHLVLVVDGSRGTSRRGEYRFTWTLTEEDGGTTVGLRGEGSGLGTLGRVIGRFLLHPFRRHARQDLVALRRWLDEDGDRDG